MSSQILLSAVFSLSLFYFYIFKVCYNFTRPILLGSAASFKQITNYIKHLTTSSEIHYLQNKYVCEVKMTEQVGLECNMRKSEKMNGPSCLTEFYYFEPNLYSNSIPNRTQA